MPRRARVLVFHWNAREAAERAEILRRAGHEAAAHSGSGNVEALRAVRADPPDAFVIDLTRLPSHGRAVAAWLRETKATRRVPIVFIEGDPEKTFRVRDLFPDADYTSWKRIRGALRAALKRAATEDRPDPIRHGVFAGYSGTPLPKKLGVGPGTTALLIGAPDGFEATLGALPEGARVARDVRQPASSRARGAQIILLFARTRAELERRFPSAARRLAEGGRLWIVWPKKTSGMSRDLGEKEVRAFGLASHFVDYKICAVDETWSGLCFARRGSAR